jgi:hypothetical protein
MGFGHVESGPLVRSSYHADEQAAHVPGAFPEGPLRITHRSGGADAVEAGPGH